MRATSLIIILSSFAAWSAFSVEASLMTYRFGKQSVSFFEHSQISPGILISSQCRQQASKTPCEALQVLSKLKAKADVYTSEGGVEPGSRICTEELKARVLTGVDAAGNERSFCRFKDGSIIDLGSLFVLSK